MLEIKDKNFVDLIRDKKIAIVGPSSHLIGKNLGNIIDEYDIVCRVNEVAACNYEKDYGKKTDIIFHNCGTHHIEFFAENLEKNYEVARQVKYVVCPCIKAVGSDEVEAFLDEQISDVVYNFQKINKYNTPFYWIGTKEYKKFYNIIGVEPNAGMTSILILLSCLPKQLLITGFSFYNQGDWTKLSVRPGHHKLDNELAGNAGHPQLPQILFFKNYILQNFSNIITIDSYLKEILSVDYDKVLKLDK